MSQYSQPRASLSCRAVAKFSGRPTGTFTPIIILGGIYAGLLTPSESAAVAGVRDFYGLFSFTGN